MGKRRRQQERERGIKRQHEKKDVGKDKWREAGRNGKSEGEMERGKDK